MKRGDEMFLKELAARLRAAEVKVTFVIEVGNYRSMYMREKEIDRLSKIAARAGRSRSAVLRRFL